MSTPKSARKRTTRISSAARLRAWGTGFRAARAGGVERSTWVEPAPQVPAGFAPLATVAECLAVFHQVAGGAGNPAEKLAQWFEVHVERAVEGREWLCAAVERTRLDVIATERSGVGMLGTRRPHQWRARSAS